MCITREKEIDWRCFPSHVCTSCIFLEWGLKKQLMMPIFYTGTWLKGLTCYVFISSTLVHFFLFFFYILYSTHLALSQLMQTATNLSFNVLCIVISNPPSWHHYYPYWLQSKTRPCSLHQFCNHELSMEFTPILRSWVVHQIHTDSVCCPWNSHPFSMLGCPRNSHWLCMLSCPWNSHHELPIEFQCTIQ